MLFIILTFFSAFLIESIGTYVSVVGLSALFSSNPVVMVLAVALDIGKLITVAFLYKHWGKMNLVMKGYMLIAAAILMLITSAGAGGYLSQQFQGAILSTKESDIRVTALKEEKTKLEARKIAIDNQIANLPANTVKGRTKLMAEFKTEIERVNNRVIEIDKELPDLLVSKAGADSHVGPILYVAKAFDTTVEDAVKYVILLIIFVFDPLAIVLIVGGNFLLDRHRRTVKKTERKKQEKEDLDRQHKYKQELDDLHHIHELEEEKVEIDKLHSHLEVKTNEKEQIVPSFEKSSHGQNRNYYSSETTTYRDLDSQTDKTVENPPFPDTREGVEETDQKTDQTIEDSFGGGEGTGQKTPEIVEDRKRPRVFFDKIPTEDNQKNEKKDLEHLHEIDEQINEEEIEEPNSSITTEEQLDELLDSIRSENMTSELKVRSTVFDNVSDNGDLRMHGEIDKPPKTHHLYKH
jgi:hypothetical protein